MDTDRSANMSVEFEAAEALVERFTGKRYCHGWEVLPQAGTLAAELGRRALLVRSSFPGAEEHVQVVHSALAGAGIAIVAEVEGAAPNAPREDVARLAAAIAQAGPDLLVSFGGGSTIDAVKAANAAHTLTGGLDSLFGTDLVQQALAAQQRQLLPHLAIQAAASSGAHLTKYANVTDLRTGQKKLIVDEAIVPQRAVFDYAVTMGAPAALTADGGLDGFSHALEVLYSAAGKPSAAAVQPVALEAIELVVAHLPAALRDPHDAGARQALGLATDLGGIAIMLGGTNGAHLTSFSLVDLLSHGRACGLLNPYYTVFFAPAVEAELRAVVEIFRRHGYTDDDPERLRGRALGLAGARAMLAFETRLGLPIRLADVPGFSDAHLERALAAAKDPQLRMKLENMPVSLTADSVDEYMRPILAAAKTGALELIRNLE